jgi:hypothetical protein
VDTVLTWEKIKLDRLLELKAPPVIGQKYLVPCVEIFSGFSLKNEFVPVLGPAHNDPELGQLLWHAHVDIRFMTDTELEHFTSVKLEEMKNESNVNISIPVTTMTVKQPTVTEHEKLCIRQGLDLRGYKTPLGWLVSRYISNAETNKIMEDQQEHKKMDLTCRICPHRNFPLNSVPVYENVVICPGHGLQWCVKTGKLVRRTGPKGKHVYKKGTQEVHV